MKMWHECFQRVTGQDRGTCACWGFLAALPLTFAMLGHCEAAQSADGLNEAFVAALKSKSLEDMRTASQKPAFRNEFVREGLWYAAATWSLHGEFQHDESLQVKVIKVFVFATLLELEASGRDENWPQSESLFNLGPLSLESLDKSTSLAKPGSPLAALFSRGPKLHANYWTGYYHYLRFDIGPKSEQVVLERSDVPWSNLSLEYSVTQRKNVSIVDSRNPLPVEALSYSFPLSALNYFVIAAKAYACLTLLGKDSPHQKYAFLIIANSLYAASLTEGNGYSAVSYSRAATFPMRKAILGFYQVPANDGHLLTAENLEARMTAMAFFGRKLDVAEQAYGRAAKQQNREKEYRIYGVWGGLISAIGLRNDKTVTERLKVLFTLIDDEKPDHATYRYMLVALADTFDRNDPVGLFLAKQQKRLEHWRHVFINEYDRYKINLDLQRILWTVGRFHEAVALWIREIERLPAKGIVDSTIIEKEYLHELGASINDVFAELSWQLDIRSGGQFIARNNREEEWLKDFAPTWIDRYFDRGEGRPYGAVSPEEDQATCFESHNMINSEVIRLVSQILDKPVARDSPETKSRKIPGGELVPWARKQQELNNFEPLLKLAWVEWFAMPLEQLGWPNFNLHSWTYQVLSVEDIATPHAVQKVIESNGRELELATLRVANTFLNAYSFLKNRYGAKLE